MADRGSLIRRYYAAIDAGDLATVLAMFSDEIVYRRPGYPDLVGRRAFDTFYRSVRRIASGCHTLQTVIASEHDVAVQGSFSGRSHDGTALAIRFADFFHFSGDLIVERNTYFDAPGV